jgi:hypothetical protein
MLINVSEWRSDILQEHAEELEALWNRRLRAERSSSIDGLALRRLDRRIEAHADALVLAGGHATRFIEQLFMAAEVAPAAAAAFVVGCSDDPVMVQRLVEVLAAAPSEVRLGIWAALELRAGRNVLDLLAKASSEAELEAGAVAVLAAHDPPRAEALQPGRLLVDPSPVGRALAWRAVRRLGRAMRLEPSHYERGIGDVDITARRAALEAAVATRQSFLLEHLRRVAAAPDVARLEDHLLFAVLAGPADVSPVLALAAAPALGWERYRVLSLCGRAPAIEALVAVMRAGDPVESALAGAAFYRITGVDVAGDERVPLVPAGTEPDDFTDVAHVCDLARAERAWHGLRTKMGGARWAYGVDTDATAPAALPDVVDLESRWAAELRATFSVTDRRLRFAHESFLGAALE